MQLRVFHPTRVTLAMRLACVLVTGSMYGQVAPPVTVLSPLGTVKVPIKDTEHIKSVTSTPHGIWFLEDSPTYSEAVLATESGAEQQRTLLMMNTGHDSIQTFCVSDDGAFATVHRKKFVGLYSPSGELQNEVAFPEAALGYAFSDGQLFLVHNDNVAALGTAGSQRTIAFPLPKFLWPTLIFSVPARRIAVIEQGEGKVNLVDTNSGRWSQYQLSSPEIQGLTRVPRTATQVTAIVVAAAADEHGDIYIAIAPWVASQGLVILKFSSAAVLKARYRCIIPKSPDLVTDRIKEGYLVPAYLAVTNNTLVLISEGQTECRTTPFGKHTPLSETPCLSGVGQVQSSTSGGLP